MMIEEFEKVSWRSGVKVSDVDFDYYDIGFWRDKKFYREACKNFEIMEE